MALSISAQDCSGVIIKRNQSTWSTLFARRHVFLLKEKINIYFRKNDSMALMGIRLGENLDMFYHADELVLIFDSTEIKISDLNIIKDFKILLSNKKHYRIFEVELDSSLVNQINKASVCGFKVRKKASNRVVTSKIKKFKLAYLQMILACFINYYGLE